MKKYNLFYLLIAIVIGFTSCGDDFLTNTPTESQEAGAPATEETLESYLASCYQILLFDSYANANYNGILLMSDLRSDDIYKGGGSAGDQGQLYSLSQLDATPNETLEGLWSIYYSGLSRCNFVLNSAENPENVPPATLSRIIGEAKFLRAYYTHWLWKFWGNIPYFTEEVEAPYMVKQYKADEIYKFIMEDLDDIISGDRLPMSVSANNAGRATKAAAMMLKARVVLYQKDQARYAEVMSEMNQIVNSDYSLMEDFSQIWVREGEFCKESIFETHQRPEGKGWSSSWTGYGTNLPAFISPRDLTNKNRNNSPFVSGWGFGPVRPEAYVIYDDNDLRRAVSINKFIPHVGDTDQDYSAAFQDTGLFQGKYAAREGYSDAPSDTDLNYENNLRLFRYAEVLLNIADLAVIQGVAATGISAQSCLDQIRSRAGLGSIPATIENVKMERRREFLGEGLRFWDLVRWGDASTVLTEKNDAYSMDRKWEDYKKYLPLPQSEIDKTEGEFKLEQNQGYK